MKTSALLAAAAALAALAAAPTARAQDADHFSWRGALARGKTLEIKGIAGTIRVEASTGTEVEVTAVKRGPASDRREVHIETDQDADGVTICAVYGEGSGCSGVNRHVHDNDTEVEFVARVPAGVSFTGTMVSGEIDVTGLSADVEVNSVSGDVAVHRVRGDVNAHSVSGDATLDGVDGQQVRANTVSGEIAFTGPIRADGTYELRSVSGDLTVRVDGDFNARVSLSTVSGDLQSDFPVTVGGGGRFGRRNLDFTVGNGGPRLELATVSGDFHLQRAGAAGR